MKKPDADVRPEQSAAVVAVRFSSFARSVPEVLDAIGAAGALARQRRILLKPNLVCATPPPVTTPVELCAAVIDYVRAVSAAEIVIAEGCGDARRETGELFSTLGYADLARRTAVALVDLNHAPLILKQNPQRPCFPEMYLPELLFTHYVVSLPVLKAHSLAHITGALKNMMGAAPPRYYGGGSGTWKKARFHANMQQAISDLISYRQPDLALLDASIGLPEYHLGGRRCSPPLNTLIAGFDARAVDRAGATLLGLDWRSIQHLCDDR